MVPSGSKWVATILSNALVAVSPDVNVGDSFPGAIVGVIDDAFAKSNLLTPVHCGPRDRRHSRETRTPRPHDL